MAALSASSRLLCFRLAVNRQNSYIRSVQLVRTDLIRLPSLNCYARKYSSRQPQPANFTFEERDRKRKTGTWGYFLLLIPITAFFLGTWQVKRRAWKLDLIKSLEERTNEPPIDFPYDIEELKTLEYRRVRLRGTFDHSKEIYLTPRSLITQGGADSPPGGGLISSTQAGALVITPFTLADRDLTILVNRGWVPRKNTLPHTRLRGQIVEEVDLVGVVRLPEKQASFVPNNDLNSVYWHWRDVEKMAAKLGTEQVFLDATSESSVPGGPVGGQTRISLRNEHMSYILTWYSLSAATAFIWYKKFVRGAPVM